MMTDQSYTPLRSEFDHVLKAHFPNVICPQQIKVLQDVFFAGAAASYQILTMTPERTETLMCQLVDHTEQMEARERV